jgi:hypothetical protein
MVVARIKFGVTCQEIARNRQLFIPPTVMCNPCALNEPEIFNFEVQCSLNDGSRSSVNAVQTGLTNHSTVLLG